MSINAETLVQQMNHEIAAIQPSDILAFNAEIASIPGIVRLTLGEPDFNTPEHVKQAAIKSIETMKVTMRLRMGRWRYELRQPTS